MNKNNKKCWIFSISDYNNLDEDFKKNKAIIRIHNYNEIDWYKELEKDKKNLMWIFFDDISINQLNLIEKIKIIYLKQDVKNMFSRKKATIIKKFIENNKNKDFIIHCEYGKSRSVAIGKFLEDYFGYKIENKTKKEINKANTLILNLLK